MLAKNGACIRNNVYFCFFAWACRAGPASKLILCRLSDIISRPLIGQKYEYYIVIEVIEVDELDKGNISAAA